MDLGYIKKELEKGKKKILIIDDNQFSLHMAKSLLDSEFFETYCVSNYFDGIRELSVNKYDLLILDWNLDELTGGDVLKFVDKSYDENERVPFVLYTGVDAQKIILPQTENFRLIDFWSKNENLDTWTKKVTSILKRLK